MLVATVVQRSVGFGRGVLFCRWMSPEALGEWEMAFSFLLLAAPLAVLGVPGSFGRYAEHYRQRGHLRTFTLRTAWWTLACTVGGVALIQAFAGEIAHGVFGRPDYAPTMRILSWCLAAVILHHTLGALLTALRLCRIVTAMGFIHSMLFAVLSLALIWRQPHVISIVYAYAIASLIAAAGAMAWAWPALAGLDRPVERIPHNEFWGKLLRFAFYVWVANLLTHLFAIIDRTMLVHCAGLSPAEALDQIGHYHSSRIIPLLMVSVAELLAGLVMPHLSHDWEQGRRESVSSRLNLAIKLSALGMLAVGACILAAAPFLFHVVLEGRYNAGLAVLPWTLAGCVWYGVYLIAQNYLWCAEKTRLSVAPLAMALAVNVALNLVLLPKYGLYGAVLATALSTTVCLFSVLEMSRWHGMRVDAGTWLAAAAPVALGFGLWPALAVCAAMAALTAGTSLVLTPEERRELTQLADSSLARAIPSRRRAAAAS